MLPKDRKELLKRWSAAGHTFKRDIEDAIGPLISADNAVFLYGPRRAGKSTIAKRLSSAHAKTSRYANLEDPSLSGSLGYGLLDELAEGLEPDNLLVLDEVQVVDGWEKWVRRAVDLKLYNIIVTGSSSKLLSSEFATTLGGRGIGFQVLPLSYSEYHRVTKQGFGAYLETGGYPEVALNPERKGKLLESYFEQALIRDIVSRYDLREPSALRNLAYYLLTNSGKETSLKQLRAALGLSYDTLRQFVDYLESAFLIFQVPFFAYSMKMSLTRPRKTYAWDNGMQSYASRSFSRDSGRKAENAVAIELRRRGLEVFYWKGAREVDFVAKKQLSLEPINVCYSGKPGERETSGLLEFCGEHRLGKATLLYAGPDTARQFGKTTVNYRNLEKWLLRPEKAAPGKGAI